MKWLIIDDGSVDYASINGTDYEIVTFRKYDNDPDYHNWTLSVCNNASLKGIIMPLHPYCENVYDSLIFGFHLRLNYELPLHLRFLPIIFLTDFTKDNIIDCFDYDDNLNLQLLLHTKGVYISAYLDLAERIKEVNSISSKTEYRSFLRQINIHKPNQTGNHDIANSWGCYKLSKIVGCDSEVLSNYKVSTKLKDLYAKYLICQNEPIDQQDIVSYIKPNCVGKKILYIDDKADEGWAVLMSIIFSKAGDGFVFIDPSKYKTGNSFNYSGFEKECKSLINKKWDLIIIDLRLNPEHEDIDTNRIGPEGFSGYELAAEFFQENEGNQIITLTASNKVWNIQALLNIGVSAYYIKESPTTNSSFVETKKQYEEFIQNANASLKRSRFLRGTFTKLVKIQNLCCRYFDWDEENSFYKNCVINCEVAFELLKKSFQNNKYLSYAYLQTFLIAEEFVNLDCIFIDESIITYKGCPTYKVLNRTSKENIRDSAISFDSDNSMYIKAYDQYTNRNIDTMFKMSALLLFAFGHDNSKDHNWQYLNYLRNNVAHKSNKKDKHGNSKDIRIDQKNYESLLDFMIYLFDEKNANPVDPSFALPETLITDEN